jgi:hypothetical protein
MDTWTYVATGLAVVVGFIYWKFFSDSGDPGDSYEQMVLKIKPIERTTTTTQKQETKKVCCVPTPVLNFFTERWYPLAYLFLLSNGYRRGLCQASL